MPGGELRRRAFLGYCGALGLGQTLFPGALWAQADGGAAEITSDMIDSAARLAGLRFSAADRDEMVAGINANLASYEALREIRIDQHVPPPLYFNPAVPGQTFDTRELPFARGPRARVTRPANLEEVAFWPVTDLAQLIESRAVSATELTRMYIARIRRYDPILHSVITLTEDLALEQAAKADEEIAAGEYRGPLHGIPWGAKDVIAKRGYKTTWGSFAYQDQVVDIDATVTARLEEAGAVLVAKLSTGEIARGDRWFGGQTRNPWNVEQGSGGSSAGSGAATAAGLVGFALGSDTTGSILGPARNCGITGLRPSFGRVSRHGVMPVCWSLDKVGPMCRSVEDCALVFEAIRGPDLQDLAVVDMPFNWDGGRPIDDLRVGYLEQSFAESEDPRDAEVLAALRSMGVDPKPIALPEHAEMDALQMLLVDEAAAFDELIQTGRVDMLIQDREEPEDMLMRVVRLLPAVEYLQIQRRRMLVMQGMERALRDIDVYLAPQGDDVNRRATSLTGHPAVSVPSGFDEDGMPASILFVGKLYGEADLLALAKAYQDANDFHTRHPALN